MSNKPTKSIKKKKKLNFKFKKNREKLKGVE